jgi:methylthioribose-1-phosphate isomerase
VIAAAAAEVWNPAFDVTPAELITGYITDAGLLRRDELGKLSSEFRVVEGAGESTT